MLKINKLQGLFDFIEQKKHKTTEKNYKFSNSRETHAPVKTKALSETYVTNKAENKTERETKSETKSKTELFPKIFTSRTHLSRIVPLYRTFKQTVTNTHLLPGFLAVTQQQYFCANLNSKPKTKPKAKQETEAKAKPKPKPEKFPPLSPIYVR